MTDSPRIAVLISFSGAGGVERMVLNLVEEFARRGYGIDLLLIRAEGEHLRELPEGVNVIRLGVKHTLASVRPLARWLRQNHPPVLLVAKDRAGRAALWARRLAGVDTRIAIRLGTNLSAALAGRGWLRRITRTLPMRWSYRMAERVIAVSHGVAEDTARVTGLPPERISVAHNPVITSRLLALAEAPLDHPWLAEGEAPVILGAGRLTRQKDFPTLIRAFAQARAARPCRLIILGDGGQRDQLLALATELGVADDVDLPGFATNPYAWMRAADLFVLSSLWEGSPNVLTEAMACGTPVVSTDCPSGPRETLQDGRFGPLVSMGDPTAIGQAILDTLANPPSAETMQAAVTDFAVTRSADEYLDILSLPRQTQPSEA
ncbi:MAG: glycosyltransferase [Gammaproteobacteria bacterium]|nr:glycosyltransferase [Gammaproteobacteria bacterium]MCF6362750.1 glycosyltransferase [Gammaproteobacteria bacterium]